MIKLLSKIFMYVSLMFFAAVMVLIMKNPWTDPVEISDYNGQEKR